MCKPEPIRDHNGAADGAGKAPDVWHVLDVDSCMDTLKTSMRGLSSSQAQELLKVHGYNQLTEKKKKTLLERIWGQVNNVLVGILAVVAVVSAAKAATAKSTEDAITNWLEVALIVFVISLNAWIGIMQEGSAEKAANALKSMLSSDAEVVRDGVNTEIPANELVPGDIVVIKTGDRIPADIRMLETSNLACTEAALTGESLPVEKVIEALETNNPAEVPLGDRKNMAFSATLCSQGRGLGIVCCTGDNTQIGTINALVNNVEQKKTAVLEQIDNVSKVIACFVVLCGLITFFVAYFHVDQAPLDSVAIALVCAVAMIPEGLASIVSLTYAYAVSNMAKLNAIVRMLPAVETLGSVTVICSDKTGTLTKNEMTLTAFVTSEGRYQFNTDSTERVSSNFVRNDAFMAYKSGEDNKAPVQSVGSSPVANGQSPNTAYFQSAMACGVLCGNSKLGVNGGRDGEIGNPTELAIVRAAYFSGCDVDGMKTKSPTVAEVPFSSEYKFMATVHEPVAEIDGAGNDGEYVVYVKGAPDRMVAMCSHQFKGGIVGEENIEPVNTEYWNKQISILSSYGLRCLALCRTMVPKDSVKKGEQLKPDFVKGKGAWLTIVGLCAIMDPPRPECVDAIKVAHKAGIRVVMITGDHKDTALAIGEMLGLVDEKFNEAKTGPELDNMDDMQLRHAVMNYNVFARASPQNKIQIVEALQAEQQVCSMTGDGVNDAPALKKADMGVAMGKEGTDVAREASEMILADDNFATIVAAVREGRVVWDNLRKILFVNTPINNAQGLTVLFGMIFGMKDTLLTPIQVLYCNLICAVTLGFVLAVEPAEDGIMLHKPRKPGKRLIGRFLLLRILIATVTLVSLTVGASYLVRGVAGDNEDGKKYDLAQIRSQASNTLTFSAISVTMSARFSYLSSLHPRLFRGNPFMWYSLVPLVILQLMITYIPGLNSVLFGMGPMDWMQWVIVLVCMVITFLVMETEKSIRSSLKSQGSDTDDEKYDARFDN
ncbi:Sodium/potassium-transporting ATPase subunit alpha [Seminavis robusta]|uniref:Sodium/potassium exporting P-type ATPase 1 n=1 Tax=Seminavis robusta TaxID=568900 RepID=A0A9N8DEL7_9STRA|nr:Sodium/potassium-transporting ATPase subunit alpha [Seminavis robusta]|eukprot:Sro86_g045760.1 Sodium/potassium-transporting ATPase subunit alpha (999) ;mRNA; f:63317-66411